MIDSAEGALRNQYMLDYEIALQPVAKRSNLQMVDIVQNALAQGRIFFLDKPANEIFYDEHKKYQWDEKTLRSDNPKVVKTEDHTVDGLKYVLLTTAKHWGLEV